MECLSYWSGEILRTDRALKFLCVIIRQIGKMPVYIDFKARDIRKCIVEFPSRAESFRFLLICAATRSVQPFTSAFSKGLVTHAKTLQALTLCL